MFSASVIAANSNTRETTPSHIWTSQVLQLADVSFEDMANYFTRERLSRAYSAGEPVWMAADALRVFVRDGKRHERIEREANYLAGKMKVNS